MTSFLDNLGNVGTTNNGAATNLSTLDPVLDLFSQAGAMRNNVLQAGALFDKAFKVDPQAAVRVLFYLRDIRGGQGERNLFRELYGHFMRLDPVNATRLLSLIPEYGRWDDLFAVSTVDNYADIVETQMRKDEFALKRGESISLMAKWLPSENASSAKSRSAARALASALGMTNRDYRKTVTRLRAKITLLETTMSNNEWSTVDYSKLPSQAGRKHAKAFRRHDDERFTQFMDRATKGEVKLNAGTLFTYEIFDALNKGDDVGNAFWANLPDYTNGKKALVVADTSGSMGSIRGYYGFSSNHAWNTGDPIAVSVSLALYFAERNTGPFKDTFLTFSDRPALVKVTGRTLSEKLANISRANWGMNTNIEAVFTAVLNAAKKAAPEDVPEVIYIISDMEFDVCSTSRNSTNFDNAQRMFNQAGIKMPHLVFWNVNARAGNTPATKYDSRVSLVSGLSQSAFKLAVEGKTPVELMQSVINSERYAPVLIPAGNVVGRAQTLVNDGAPGTSGYNSFSV